MAFMTCAPTRWRVRALLPPGLPVVGFMGTPAMNFMEGTLNKKRTGIYFNEENFEIKLPDNFTDWWKANNDWIKQGIRLVYRGLAFDLKTLWSILMKVGKVIFKIVDFLLPSRAGKFAARRL
jgi:hypothetical protein